MKLTKTQIIGAILFVTGKSVDTVARENGYTKAAFYNVFSGSSKSSKLRALISGIVAPVVDEIIWPEPAKDKKEQGLSPGRDTGVVVGTSHRNRG